MNKFTKTANEAITIEFEFARALEYLWLPGQEYAVNDYVRPTTPNGFEYQCSNAGQTDNEEPDWPTTLSSPETTITDGSVIWNVKDFGTNATDTIDTPTATGEIGITVGSPTVDGTKVSVRVSGGSVGRAYVVTCKITTVAGDTYEEQVRVTVK